MATLFLGRYTPSPATVYIPGKQLGAPPWTRQTTLSGTTTSFVETDLDYISQYTAALAQTASMDEYLALAQTNNVRAHVQSLGPDVYLPLRAADLATDISGNNRTPETLAGGIVPGAGSGNPGVAEDTSTAFDGVDDRLQYTSYTPFVEGGAVSFLGFAYRNVNTSGHRVFGGNTGTKPYMELVTGTNNVTWRNDQTGPSVSWAGAFPLASWVSWMIVVRRTTDQVLLYINGSLVTALALVSPFNAPGALQIGAAQGSVHFAGRMAHFAVVPREVTAGEFSTFNTLGTT